jgi:soluble lytic murein transglycosylase
MLGTVTGSTKRVAAAVAAIMIMLAGLTQHRTAFAQLFPFQSNKAEAIDPRQAFVEGYRAYLHGDYAAAIGPLQLASTLPDLGDYALYYLAAAQAASGDRSSAANNYRRIAENYPQSILAHSSQVEYARIELKLGNLLTASATAQRVANQTQNPAFEQSARIVIAQAAYKLNDLPTAYAEAQRIREKYPRGAADGEARALSESVVAAEPSVTGASPLRYHFSEGGLLVREGQLDAARSHIREALVLAPPPVTRAELYWLLAEASRADAAQTKAALARYLVLAPRGSHAPAALDQIAHLYWRDNDTGKARIYFGRIVTRFPTGEQAANAMFEIGRTYEDDGNLDAARNEYLRLTRRFTIGEAAETARFRAPLMLYMQHRYAAAATAFGVARGRVAAADWAMFAYWQARALEQGGNPAQARDLMTEVARDTRSNYYPALASRRVGIEPDPIAAATTPDPIAGAVPQATGVTGFHLARITAFRQLGLRELEAPELRALSAANDPAMRNFVLAEMQDAGAWYDAIQLATAMLARGEVYPTTAERIRYPRGYWELVSGEATRMGLDQWLLAALIRQESLYNPAAQSVSDARGLMQLLPTTAEHWAPAAGISGKTLDLYDPVVSVRIGTTYLKGLFTMFDGNPFRAVAAYNGGEHAVAGWLKQHPGDDDQWVENIGYQETRDYVKKVLGGSREYRLLYAQQPAAATTPAASPSPTPG